MSSLLRFLCIPKHHHKSIKQEEVANELYYFSKNIKPVIRVGKDKNKLAKSYYGEAYAQEERVLVIILLVRKEVSPGYSQQKDKCCNVNYEIGESCEISGDENEISYYDIIH
jgi:hypothetical protein